ncbi:uncharacterized protein LOC117125331 [Anneissia japonica]|uniref:uncharacterized protein LOC117125331 n=1 Tax=Anneissia japonica TaxID=1529436 RepID=UPI0014257F0D|nr:uncharacterized protein LOC117125331 [Anneissia japonica]
MRPAVTFLTVLLISCLFMFSNGTPLPGGANVCSRKVSIQETRKVSYAQSTCRSGTTKCGTWGWNRCKKYWKSYSRMYRTEAYTVYSTNYYCCSGWAENNVNHCTIPICNVDCGIGGICVQPNICSCNPGFIGLTCEDKNECLENYGGCDRVTERCVNTDGSFYCECFTGYARNSGSGTCQPVCTPPCVNGICLAPDFCSCFEEYTEDDCRDLDECFNDNGGCQQLCENYPGGFRCECFDGYSLSQLTNCVPVCEPHCQNNGQCVGPNTCDCPDTYSGKSCEEDIDECTENNDNCDQICENLPGSFTCSCQDGFLGTSNCSDINECDFANCDTCLNTIGSFVCTCNSGYEVVNSYHCEDVNECLTESSGCAQECTNTAGSYLCSCSRGWTLNYDQRTCSANPCVDIGVPFNSTRNCTGFTTGESCTFTCGRYHHLTGSSKRTCLPSGEWSGTSTRCEEILCPELDSPVNGYILYPCDNSISNVCGFGCDNGYKLTSELRLVCMESGNWNASAPQCREIQACVPSPCVNGICHASPSELSGFYCDCSGTGYTGTRCSEGFIKTPTWPRIILNNTYNNLRFFAQPKTKLELKILTDATRLSIEPSRLIFTNSSTMNTVSVRGISQGFTTIYYVLSGEDAESFTTPEYEEVYIYKQYTQKNGHFSPGYQIPGGCFEVKDQSICGEKGLQAKLVSTEKWSYRDTQLKTTGVVSLNTSTLQIPIYFEGYSYNYYVIPEPCDICKSMGLTDDDIQWFVDKHSMYRTYINQLEHILPDWITFISIEIDPEQSKSAFSGSVLSGDKTKENKWCAKAPVMSEGQYFVYLLQKAEILIGGRILGLPLTLSKGKYCLAIGVCDDTLGSVIITFPHGSRDILNYIQGVGHTPNLSINVTGLAFSTTNTLNSHVGQGATGNQLNLWSNLQYSYIINQSVNAEIEGEGDINVWLENTSVLFSELFIQPWLLQQLGVAKLKLYWKVYGEDILLEFTSTPTNAPIATAKFGADFSGGSCCCDVERNGILIESTMQLGVFDSTPFWRLLQPEAANSPIQVLLQYDLTPQLIIPYDVLSVTSVVDKFENTSAQLAELAEELTSVGLINDMAITISFRAKLFQNLVFAYHSATMEDDVTVIAGVLSNITANCKFTLNDLWAVKDELSYREQNHQFWFPSYLKENIDDAIASLEFNRNALFIQIQSTFVNETISGTGFLITCKVCFSESLCMPALEINVFDSVSKRNCGDTAYSFPIDNYRDPIWITGEYTNRLTLNSFITIPDNSQFVVAMSSTEERFLGKVGVSVNLLGINEVTAMCIEKEGIYFGLSGRLWGFYDCKINITSDFTSWDSMILNAEGDVDVEKENSLGAILKHKTITTAERSLHMAEQRIAQGIASVEMAQNKLHNATKEKQKIEATMIQSQLKYEMCVRDLEAANDEVEQAQASFEDVGDDILELQDQLDSVCAIVPCPGICIPTTEVIQTTEDVYSFVPYTCCSNRIEDTVVYERTSCCYSCEDCTPVKKKGIKVFRVIRGSLAIARGRVIKGSYLVATSVSSKTRMACMKSECCYECYNPVIIEVTFRTCSTCTKKTMIGQITKPTVVENTCGYQIPDSNCIRSNEYCREVRNKLYKQSEASAPGLASPIAELENARVNAAIKESSLNEARIELEDANSQLEAVNERVYVLQENLNNSKTGLEEVKQDVQSDLHIKQFEVNGSLSTSFVINKIGFNIDLTVPDIKTIPMDVSYTLLHVPSIIRIFIDFNNFNYTIDSAAVFLANEIFRDISNPLRKKREVYLGDSGYFRHLQKRGTLPIISQPPIDIVNYDFINKTDKVNVTDNVHRDQKAVYTEELCHMFTEFVQYIEYSFHTLLNIANSSFHGHFQHSETVLDEYAYNLSKSPPIISANESAAIIFFNLTREELEETDGIPSDEFESNALSRVIKAEKRKIDSTRSLFETDDIFPRWEATMNRYITNDSLMFECNIFTDCLITDIEHLDNMLEGLQGYTEFCTMRTFIQSLLNKGELSVEEAEYSALFVLNHTDLLTEFNDICLESPVITKHPVSELSTVVGNDIEITCHATGDPTPTLSWRFNGRILDNKNSNTLHIQEVSKSDSGVYVCHASNEVTSVQSLECKLTVEYPPVITRHPESSDIDHGNPEGVFFVCNASSLPLADFRWFFQETLTSNSTLIEGKNDTGLEILSPGFNQSGWYTCEASNKHGRVMSKPARLTTLNITMPDISSPMELTLLEIENSTYPNRSVRSVIEEVIGTDEEVFNVLYNPKEHPGQTSFFIKLPFTLQKFNVNSFDILNASREEAAYQMAENIESLQAKALALEHLFKPGAVFEQDGEAMEVVSFTFYFEGPTCPPSQYADENGYICVECPPGSVRGNDLLPAVCEMCPKGTYQPDAGQLNCLVCKDGQSKTDFGSRDCHQQYTEEPAVSTTIHQPTVTTTVHQPTVTTTVHRPAVTTTVHQPDIITTVHQHAVTTTIHHVPKKPTVDSVVGPPTVVIAAVVSLAFIFIFVVTIIFIVIHFKKTAKNKVKLVSDKILEPMKREENVYGLDGVFATDSL